MTRPTPPARSLDGRLAIAFAVTRPARMRLDEVHFHPMGQKAEF